MKITDKEFENLISFVYNNYGIDLGKKRQLIEGRLSRTLLCQKAAFLFGEYLKLIQNDKTGEEIHLFLNKITTNHSYFARENEHFDFLLKTALPQLEKTRKGDLRIWSAGCSAGQEPYNLAMVMDQYFGPKKQVAYHHFSHRYFHRRALKSKAGDLSRGKLGWAARYMETEIFCKASE